MYTSSGTSGDTCQHPVITAIINLKNALDSNNVDGIRDQLTIIQQQCDIALPYRSLAVSHDAWSQCLAACRLGRATGNPLLNTALDTLCSLCNGQPDILTRDGQEYFITLMR